MKRYPDVAAWLADQTRFVPEVEALLSVLRRADLDEGIKWGSPTWADAGQNVANLGLRKDHAVVGFFRGALLPDPQRHLETPGEHSRHVRTLAFADLDAVREKTPVLEAFLAEAIELTRAGTKVPRLSPDEVDLPDELVDRMDADPDFAECFWGMTPGRRRGHALHIGGAKTPKGRASRLERCAERILLGKGIHDCICGKSQRMPRCDGSHSRKA